jgi:multisubunit Na+/H+ antiporter MnhB subunit
MEMKELRGTRGVLAAVALLIIFIGVTVAFVQLNGNVARGISPEYNRLAHLQQPNSLSAWVYDWRGFDTLIETGVIYVGAVVSVLVIGRGLVRMKQVEGEEPVPQTSLDLKIGSVNAILKYFIFPLVILLAAYGILIVTGAATSGGGGFQCGVVVASAYLIGAVFFGKKNPLNFRRKFLIAVGSFGWALYALLGLPGYLVTGYWQYNVGTDLWSSIAGFPAQIPSILHTIFGDPYRLALVLKGGTFYSTAGIVPLINIGEAFNVIGAICLIFLVFIYGWSDTEEAKA